MDLTDQVERRRLLAYLRSQPQLRAIENIDDYKVLCLIAGYPYVISRWLREGGSARTFDELAQLAKKAYEYRYDNLENLLTDLTGDGLSLVVRIALVPLIDDVEAWWALRDIIFDKLNTAELDALKKSNILEEHDGAFTFGDAKRRDAARSLLEREHGEAVRIETQGLIPALARSLVWRDVSTFRNAAALSGLRDAARHHRLGPLLLGLCEAAAKVLGKHLPSPDSLIDASRRAQGSRDAGFGLVLAAALFKALEEAEEACNRARPARLAGNVLVAVQDHLGGEGRMPADLDREMAPVRVEDVKRIVVDVRHRLFAFDVVLGVHIPHRRLGAANQDQKQALGDRGVGEIFLG